MGAGQGQPGERGAAPPAPSRAEWIGVALVFALALGLRLAHFLQLRAHDPFFALPSVDERMYHEWALAIRGGDWLGDQAFLNGPLYPYLLALLYGVLGPSVAAAKAVQCVLGAFACVLVWALGRRLFDTRVGLLAALGTSVYGMLIFYEGTLVVANVQVLLTLGILLASARALERPSARRWLTAGALVGLSATARPNVLLYAALLLAWIPAALARCAPPARRAALAGAFAAGTALVILPVTLRNYAVSGDFVLVTYASGLNLFIGNNPDANGVFRVPRIFSRAAADDPWEQREVFARTAEQASGRPLSPAEVSAFWRDRALEYVRAEPGRWLALELRKLALSVNAFEAWNIRSYTLTRDFSWVLRLPLLGFGAVAPLAALGLVASARRWRSLVPLYAMLACVLATLLAFFVLARYRLPIVAVLLLFAAAGLTGLADAVRGRRWRRLAAAAALLGAAALAVHWPLLREDLSVAYYNLGNRYGELGRWEDAIAAYLESIRRNPGYVSVYNNLAIAFESSGEHDAEAVRAWQQVRAMAEAGGLSGYVERADRHLHALAERASAGEPAPEP